MNRLISFLSFALVNAWLAGCASKPVEGGPFGYVDQAKISIHVVPEGKSTLKFSSERANFDFGRDVDPENKSSVKWSCKIPVTVALRGPVAQFNHGLAEMVLKANGLKEVPKSGDLFVGSGFSQIGVGQDHKKVLHFRTEDLLGVYRLKQLNPTQTAFVNDRKFYFSSFVSKIDGLEPIELEITQTPAQVAESAKNVMCAEIASGIEYRP